MQKLSTAMKLVQTVVKSKKKIGLKIPKSLHLLFLFFYITIDGIVVVRLST